MTTYSSKAIMLAVVPKAPALLSLISSVIILQSIARSKTKQKSFYHRIMVGLSMSDILASTVYFLGTWLIPRGTVGNFGPVFGAAGNTSTCNASGFLVQLAIASPLYNTTLALYYLLVVRLNWKKQTIAKIEPLLHALPIIFAFSTSISGSALNLYGSVEWLCWVNPVIPNPNTWKYQWAFLFVPLWCCVVFVTGVMVVLWRAMRKQELALSKNYGDLGIDTSVPVTAAAVAAAAAAAAAAEDSETTDADPSTPGESVFRAVRRLSNSATTTMNRRPSMTQTGVNDNNHRTSRRIARQGILYVVAFYITWFFPSLQRVLELSIGHSFFVFQFFDSFFLPLQGFFNACIYFRASFESFRRRNQEMGLWDVLKIVLFTDLAAIDTTMTSRQARRRSSFMMTQF